MKKLSILILVCSMYVLGSCGENNPVSSDTEREQVPDRGVDLKSEEERREDRNDQSRDTTDAARHIDGIHEENPDRNH